MRETGTLKERTHTCIRRRETPKILAGKTIKSASRILTNCKCINKMVREHEERNVRELMSEMKNISELMLNLANSSLFFNNNKLAKEVLRLHEELKKTEDEIYSILFRIGRSGISTDELITIVDIMECFRNVGSAGASLAGVVLASPELHPVIKKSIEESDESIVMCKVSKRSVLAEKTLGEIRFRTHTGVDVITIKRDTKWIIDPHKNTRIEVDDVLICVGTGDSCDFAKSIASGNIKTFAVK